MEMTVRWLPVPHGAPILVPFVLFRSVVTIKMCGRLLPIYLLIRTIHTGS